VKEYVPITIIFGETDKTIPMKNWMTIVPLQMRGYCIHVVQIAILSSKNLLVEKTFIKNSMFLLVIDGTLVGFKFGTITESLVLASPFTTIHIGCMLPLICIGFTDYGSMPWKKT
jgi:hypothetical protein